jgi:large subunit ribosomal protein L5e
MYVKKIKNRSYDMRYQTKYRRRRECKTDYQQRRALLIQDKNKYFTPKYRVVVRITNRDIICQVFTADLTHDECIVSAYSHELRRYGINVGLTNYAAAYCTGLLLARRANAHFGLDYEGSTEISGEEYHVEAADEGNAPFRAYLDIGLRRTTTGARIFGALKGATDGGLDIPHSDRRFPGSSLEEDDDGKKSWEFDPEIHRKYIFGGHIAEFMKMLQEENPDKYKTQFSRYIAAGIGPDDVEGMYTKAHAAIRANPAIKRDPKELGNFKSRSKAKTSEPAKKDWRVNHRLSGKERWDAVQAKLVDSGVGYTETSYRELRRSRV